jgi:hypothetical protein
VNFKDAVLMALALLAFPALAADVTYRNDIRPLIKSQCGDCHGDDAPALADFLLDQKKYEKDKLGPRLGTYGELIQLIGWPDSGAFMRRLDDGSSTADKKPGNMYKHLGENESARVANLKLLKAWLGGDGTWNMNRWQNRGDVPAISKEQMDKLILKY